MTIQCKHVIVVGGGMAGLSAALELTKDPNIRVTLLEARNRLGGRIATHHSLISPSFEASALVPTGSSSLAFDFGASWIHGVDPSNPLYSLLNQAKVKYIHTDSDIMFSQPGPGIIHLPEEESNHYWKIVWDILDEGQEFARTCRDQIPENLSLRQWLTDYIKKYQSEDPNDEKTYMSPIMKRVIPGLAMYWADENAIPLERVSMKYMDAEKIFPGEHCLVTNGLDRVVNVLKVQLEEKEKENLTALLEHVVEGIEYNEFQVDVTTNHGSFTADQILVTLPLGVLKTLQTRTEASTAATSTPFFNPPLPISKQNAIRNLGFGTMFKIFLFFPTCFWSPNVHFINCLPSEEFTKSPSSNLIARFCLNSRQIEALTVLMRDLANYSSLMPVYNMPILIGYATNRAAELMECLTDDEARYVYMCHLAHYYDIMTIDNDRTNGGEAVWPKISFMSRWNQDPFARGSYSSIPIGATPQDIEAFQVPVGVRRDSMSTTDTIEEGTDNVPASNKLIAVNDPELGRVFFAGEHTSSSHFASIQGALMSGRREAVKILRQSLV
ncbi:hypothetical protein BX616_007072 [Lobosporangium transversale]|uniref:Amine oxidase n=1 Tax=Lobosporangium transversale TaxID=64571 RepID=A0A1Y2GVM5_9FUNG|nr:amine oxidase [Lobosporangium transversale]KAF9919348.1 hypothetical protein BX616_007072 [Lobosporangium transversale]ORZ20119.1 amine oxidase [Lobosporangium transversale]|eukprot:XP_021882659.1 amine oxidase [Lobosporangium transversale]